MANRPSQKSCAECGEPLEPQWKICPNCETRLQAPVCPSCGSAVKAQWRRCPECETSLICDQCLMRLPSGHTRCPDCTHEENGMASQPMTFTDAVSGMQMVYVPGGQFIMGDTLSRGMEDELPAHAVHLDGFYMAIHPLTQAQWMALMPDNPSHFKGHHLPVEQVCWQDAQAFAHSLTTAHSGQYRFALPSEAQWEYAARGGGKDDLYAGGDAIDALAWYVENSQGATQAVGTKAPNGMGLYDMSGNVLEWCRDSYAAKAYERHGLHHPCIALPDASHVIRGGSWNLDAWSARCARRTSLRADFSGPGLGFRLVMVEET